MMDDLRDRFATLDRVPTPDVWSDVQRRLETLGTTTPRERLVAGRPDWRGSIDNGASGAGDHVRRRPRFTLLAAVALVVVLIGGAIAVGSGLVRLPSVLPPSPEPTLTTTLTPSFAEATSSPTPTAEPTSTTGPTPSLAETTPAPTPTGPLGGRLILVTERVSGRASPGDLVSIDPGTGIRTVLGTVSRIGLTPYTLQWAPDGTHVLFGGATARVDSLTDAGRMLDFICCLPPDVAWVLSPRGDLVAGLHEGLAKIAGLQGRVGVEDAVVVANVDGSGVRTVALPKGADGWAGWSWSPEGSAIVVAGCSPCTYADGFTGALFPRGVVEHNKLFIVPLDGSNVREILDETDARVFSPTWSPDGSVVAAGRTDCKPGKLIDLCTPVRTSTVLFAVADGRMTTIPLGGFFDPEMLAWSPDGTRLAATDGGNGLFLTNADGSGRVMVVDGAVARLHWSPDGKWLLFVRNDGALWIVPATGGEAHDLGVHVDGGAGLDW
jgi:dipeptidyl aminopeptidase/acylaminoacyl peptidase